MKIILKNIGIIAIFMLSSCSAQRAEKKADNATIHDRICGESALMRAFCFENYK